jgi:hypothetical protein
MGFQSVTTLEELGGHIPFKHLAKVSLYQRCPQTYTYKNMRDKTPYGLRPREVTFSPGWTCQPGWTRTQQPGRPGVTTSGSSPQVRPETKRGAPGHGGQVQRIQHSASLLRHLGGHLRQYHSDTSAAELISGQRSTLCSVRKAFPGNPNVLYL